MQKYEQKLCKNNQDIFDRSIAHYPAWEDSISQQPCWMFFQQQLIKCMTANQFFQLILLKYDQETRINRKILARW